MNPEIEKTIKKYNKIYVIELFVISAIIIALATLKLTGVIGSSIRFRHIFNIVTTLGFIWIVGDFIWMVFSKKRQSKNSWFDKITLLPFAIALIVIDIIGFVCWNTETISFFALYVSICFYYFAAVYIAQGVYHIYRPSPAMVQAAIEEYKQRELEQNKDSKEIEKLLVSVLGEGSSIVSPLVGGMMNISYIVQDKNGKKYVLYISTEQANEMVDRPLEEEHLKIIYDLGITSKNVYFDTKKGIKINEFIEGTSIDHVQEFDYEKIAKLFRTLHSSKKLSKLDYAPFERFVSSYEKEASEFEKERDPHYLELRNFLFEYRSFLESQKKVLCHNDGQRSNIVKDNNDNYWLIDFEFVGNNDPIYDIATFGNGVVSEGRKLLDYYFAKPSVDEIKRYYLWRIYVSLQWYNVAIVKHYRGEGAAHGFDFMAVAKHFLDNATDAYNSLKQEIKK